VRVQGSFAAGEFSEPEPDVCVLPLGDYDAEHPQHAHLVIEVAESSLSYERARKARLYAEAEVPEYWIVNVLERTVEVHRLPSAGQYRQVSAHPNGSRLRLLAFPDVELSVDHFLR
jgi:Uma2 family endonuclease